MRLFDLTYLVVECLWVALVKLVARETGLSLVDVQTVQLLDIPTRMKHL